MPRGGKQPGGGTKKKPKGQRRVQMAVYLQPELKETLKATAATRGVSQNSIVETAIRATLSGKVGIMPTKAIVEREKASQPHLETIKGIVADIRSEDPTSLETELIMARALLRDWILRFEEMKAAVLAWAEVQDADPPSSLIDPLLSSKLFDTITKMVRALSQNRRDDALSMESIVRISSELGNVIKAALAQGLSRLSLPENEKQELIEGILEMVATDSQPLFEQ